MSITVCGVNDVTALLDMGGYTAVLSIEHPNAVAGKGKAPDLSEYDVEQKILCFWDIEQENVPDGPSESNVAEALEFLETHQDGNIIIHCKAGKARSAAIALASLAQEYGIPEAIEHLKVIRPQAAPNLAVINIADRLLGMDGKLTAAVEADAEFSKTRAIANERRAQQIAAGVFSQDPEKAGPEFLQ